MQFACSQCNYAEEADPCHSGRTQMAAVSGELEFIQVQHRAALPGTCEKPAVGMME